MQTGGQMLTPARTIEDLTFKVTQEIHVRASIEKTFAAMLEQLGPQNQEEDGKPMPMKIEPWPGGRWFRDLGGNSGHFWANVQSIKRPTLLEFWGPLFASFPLVSNVQYRLKEVDGGTLITFRHVALGVPPEDYREGIPKGWAAMNDRVRKRAEDARPIVS
jgi:hypothetical protein